MTNYFVSLMAVTALCAGACCAAATPPAAKPAAPASAQAAGGYVGTGGSVKFTFLQAGAANTGWFNKFSTELVYDEKTPTAGRLDVTLQIASLETQDRDRNETLQSADLFDTAKYPTARYLATSFARGANGQLEAVGKLTLRGVTRDLRIPLQIHANTQGITLSGETTIRRLDFGVGQGDWKSTDTVANEVKVQYQVPMVRPH